MFRHKSPIASGARRPCRSQANDPLPLCHWSLDIGHLPLVIRHFDVRPYFFTGVRGENGLTGR